MGKQFQKLIHHLMTRRGSAEEEPEESYIREENVNVYPFNNATALASDLVRLRSRPVEHRIGRPRASSVYSCCIRRHLLGKRVGAVSREAISVHQRLLFGIGTALHLWLQNEPDIFGRRRRGYWKCAACGAVTSFSEPPVHNCKKCGARPGALRYHELSLQADDPPITGHPDMFLARHDGTVRLTEFKSVDGDRFEKLTTPDIDYSWQVMTYVYLCARLPQKVPGCDPNMGFLFYFTKKNKKGVFPCKCFPIQVTDDSVQPILSKLDLYKRGQNDQKWLPALHSECRRSEFKHYRASTCEVKTECQTAFESSE